VPWRFSDAGPPQRVDSLVMPASENCTEAVNDHRVGGRQNQFLPGIPQPERSCRLFIEHKFVFGLLVETECPLGFAPPNT